MPQITNSGDVHAITHSPSGYNMFFLCGLYSTQTFFGGCAAILLRSIEQHTFPHTPRVYELQSHGFAPPTSRRVPPKELLKYAHDEFLSGHFTAEEHDRVKAYYTLRK